MKTFLLYLVGAIAILIVFGFVFGYITYSKQNGDATITVDTEQLEEAKKKTREATAEVAEDIGDAARKGGRKLEEAGDELQRETTNNRRDPDAAYP
jgi:Flp pilus assembly protein TadB